LSKTICTQQRNDIKDAAVYDPDTNIGSLSETTTEVRERKICRNTTSTPPRWEMTSTNVVAMSIDQICSTHSFVSLHTWFVSTRLGQKPPSWFSPPPPHHLPTIAIISWSTNTPHKACNPSSTFRTVKILHDTPSSTSYTVNGPFAQHAITLGRQPRNSDACKMHP
jgi:hypothetical protein